MWGGHKHSVVALVITSTYSWDQVASFYWSSSFFTTGPDDLLEGPRGWSILPISSPTPTPASQLACCPWAPHWVGALPHTLRWCCPYLHTRFLPEAFLPSWWDAIPVDTHLPGPHWSGTSSLCFLGATPLNHKQWSCPTKSISISFKVLSTTCPILSSVNPSMWYYRMRQSMFLIFVNTVLSSRTNVY